MNDEPLHTVKTWKWTLTSVLLFWLGYLGVTFAVGFGTSLAIHSEVWQITAWGLIGTVGLIFLSRLMSRRQASTEQIPRTSDEFAIRPSSLNRFSFGFALGVVSFAVHVAIISVLAGPIRFEWVPGIGAMAASIYFVRFLATSCMEEIGFRGYALQRLMERMGPWPAVVITSVAFGLSHLSYGYDLRSIAFGVIPGGLLWGMSAIATRGLAVPIGLHAAWNFANWTAGGRSETGLLTMIVEDDALELTQTVGVISYVSIFGALSVFFWLVQRDKSGAG
jgi:membrane protease YdiL (CAAX protease family)